MSLYLSYFGLQREPFSIVPDPSFLYPSTKHRQAVAHLKYGLDREGGFILLTGEVGTGKTTITRTLLKSLPAHVRVAYVLNSKLEVDDLLASICHELDVRLDERVGVSYTKMCTDALYQDLLAVHADGKKTLIVLEEAQNLTADVLETLRLLSNLETDTDKLLHILLVGQPELLETLARRELRQLNQRVVARFHLQPLGKEELASYINHRLHKAGAKQIIFNNDCYSVLYGLTAGVPRLINIVCQHSLLAAYSQGHHNVSGLLVKRAAAEVLSSGSNGSNFLRGQAHLVLIVCLFLLGCGLGAYIYLEESKYSLGSGPDLDKLAIKGSQYSDGSDVSRSDDHEKPKSISAKGKPFMTKTDEVLSVEEKLLRTWVPGYAILNINRPFDEVIGSLGLRMERVEGINIEELLLIDRPGIVKLMVESIAKSFLLTEIQGNAVSLLGDDGPKSLKYNEFLDIWLGNYVYLWKPPQSYSILREGSSNRPLLEWLQTRLAIIDDKYEEMITGGRYTEAIRLEVLDFQTKHRLRADGILGAETTMKINRLTDPSIPSILRKDA